MLSGGSQSPGRCRNASRELGSAGGLAPSAPGTKDTVRNLAEAEDSLSEVGELSDVGRQDAPPQLG